MAEIINLRMVRKQKSREAKEADAAQNRAKYGRSKAEKALEAGRSASEQRFLDGHQREQIGPREDQ